MITAIIICCVLGAIFGAGLLFGAMIHYGNETDEHALPWEPDADTDLHREIHGSRWSV